MKTVLARAGLALMTLIAPVALASLAATAQAAVDTSNPQRFVETLTTDGFAAMRSGDRAAAKAKFRALLMNNVAVNQIGPSLIRAWLPRISPAQKAAYEAALPNYIIGTYADRLFDYADAKVTVVRTTPNASGADVVTQVMKPGRQPIPVVWSLTNQGGAWKVLNLRVGGINIAMAQAADFNAVIQRQGFDALVQMMKSRS